MSEANAGVGWYEVIHPVAATTEIVRVMEDGSIYCPEGVLTRTEFAFAAARGNAHLLVRADDLAAHDEQVRAEERERIALALEVLMRQHDLAQIGFSAIGDAYAHAARIARQGGSDG